MSSLRHGCIRVVIPGCKVVMEGRGSLGGGEPAENEILVSDMTDIFGLYGKLLSVMLSKYGTVIEFENRYDADDAFECMDLGKIRDRTVEIRFYPDSLRRLLKEREWGSDTHMISLEDNDESKMRDENDRSRKSHRSRSRRMETSPSESKKRENREHYRNDDYNSRSDAHRKRLARSRGPYRSKGRTKA